MKNTAKEKSVVLKTEQEQNFEMKHPKAIEYHYLTHQLKTLDAYHDMVSGRDGLPDEYEKAKTEWQEKKKEVLAWEKMLPSETLEEYAENVNISEAAVRQRFEQVSREIEELKAKGEILTEEAAEKPVEEKSPKDEEEKIPKPKPSEDKKEKETKPLPEEKTLPPATEAAKNIAPTGQLEGWKSLWRLGQWLEAGNPWPSNVTEEMVRNQVDFVGKARGKNTLAYSYWKKILADASEAPARNEAMANRSQVRTLEEENEKLRREIAKLKEETVTPPAEEEEWLEEGIEENEGKEEEIKKGLGARFKDGVKGFFNKFKKDKKEKPAGEEKAAEEEPEEKEAISSENAQEKAKKALAEKEAKIAELKEEIEKLKKEERERIKQSGVIEQGQIEEEYRRKITVIEAEIEKLEKLTDGPSIWGWLKERAKGTATFGLWEHGRATGFLLKTRRTGIETKAQAELLKRENGLLLDENEDWDEALEVEENLEKEERDWVENYGAEPERARTLAVRSLSAEISQRNKERNQEKEDDMVQSALRKLEEKLKDKVKIGREYMTAHGGKIITPEKMALVEKKMREEIGRIRRGQARKDLVNFGKLYREALDDKWWLRYIYGALEEIGLYAGWKWVVSPWLFGKAAAATIAAAEGGQEAVKYADQTGLKNTIWDESRRLLQRVGIAHPDNTQIQKISEVMAKDSGVRVVKETGELLWPSTAGGASKDIALPSGFPLMLKNATNAALEIVKAGLKM